MLLKITLEHIALVDDFLFQDTPSFPSVELFQAEYIKKQFKFEIKMSL